MAISLAGVYDELVCSCVIATVTDVTTARSLEARLRDEALRDGLTGLANRRAFEAALEEACAPESRPFALLYVDLDDFKPINDLYGHGVGDEMLAISGKRLARAVANTDVVARLGGDEFAILLYDLASRVAVEAVVRRVTQAIEAQITIGETRLHVGASVGVSIESGSDRSATQVLTRADAAMYEAKRSRTARGSAPRPARRPPLEKGRTSFQGVVRESELGDLRFQV